MTLIPIGQVLAAKDWKSKQIWLIQFISISIILIFWFGDFDSFLTGFGCQRLKKSSNLPDSLHFNFYNSDLLVWWLWFLFDWVWLPKIEKVIKSGWFKSFQLYNSDLLVWWLWFLFDGFWLPKLETVFKSGCWCAGFHSSFGWRVAGAKASAPI